MTCDSYYQTTEWKQAKAKALSKTYGLDLFSFYECGHIEYAHTVHHIVPLEEDYTLRANKDNLIPLTEKNHRAIHKLYKSGHKQEIIKKLKEYLAEFESEFSK